MKTGLKIALFVAIVLIGYIAIESPMQRVRFEEEKKMREKAIIQRLVDIRTAQVAFKEKYGRYTANFDSLINFVKNDFVPVVFRQGMVTDSMLQNGIDEKKAIALGLIVRDTSFVKVAESIYPKGFAVDSLRIVPFTSGAKFNLLAGEVKTASNQYIKVFEANVPYVVYLGKLDKQEVTNMEIFCEKYNKFAGLRVGNVTEANNNAGNWE